MLFTMPGVDDGAATSGRMTARSLVGVALFAALTAVGGLIRIPIPPVPFTLQTMFVYAAGGLLGSRRAALSQLVFLAVGLSGVPVFSMGGGPGYVLQPTFGYILAFPVGAWLTGRLVERIETNGGWLRLVPAHAAGLAAIHLVGVAYLYLILNIVAGEGISWSHALWSGSILFLPGEIVKAAVSIMLIERLRPMMRRELSWNDRG